MNFQFPEISACKVTVFSCHLFNTGGGGGGGGGLQIEIFGGVGGSGVQTLKLSQTEICNFLVPFFKFRPIFRSVLSNPYPFFTFRPNGLKTIPLWHRR